MTTGALIFAFNNSEIDYVSMADWSAANIRRHLNIPVAVVTDCDRVLPNVDHVIKANPGGTDSRYFEDIGRNVPWYNANRVDAYKLSPWHTTLVLDADYVVASDCLAQLFHSNSEFMCHRSAYDMSNLRTLDDLNHFGKYRMPMWWATVMLFRRGSTADAIFTIMNMIKNNWQHYRDLYQINQTTYRNDYALSIALCVTSGHTLTVDEIPWQLASVMPDQQLSCRSVDSYTVKYVDSAGNNQHICFDSVDFHAMGKQSLGDLIASP